MSAATVTSERSVNQNTPVPTATAEAIFSRLQRLPHAAWPDLVEFIEFLEYKWSILADDEALWQAVQKEQAYRQTHPEDVILCESLEDLAAVLGDDV